MKAIEHTGALRSAFLKIGWAPVIAYGGSVLLYFIGFMTMRHSFYSLGTIIGTAKWVAVGCPLLAFIGYIMSYAGFKQAQRAFGATPAGVSFSTLKTLFVIFSIFGALNLIYSIVLISTAKPVTAFATAPKAAGTVEIIATVLSLISMVYTIVALFIIRSKMKTIAYTTNVESLEGAYVGARVIIYTLCAVLILMIFAGIASGKTKAIGIISLVIGFITLNMLLYSIVKWVKGWLGAAMEVRHIDVEAEEHTDQQENSDQEENTTKEG